MGMYDEIKYKGIVYQTKSLDEMMEVYEIRNDKIFKTIKTLEGWKTEACNEIIKITGTISFYRLHKSNRMEQYDAFFRKGKLITINKYFIY